MRKAQWLAQGHTAFRQQDQGSHSREPGASALTCSRRPPWDGNTSSGRPSSQPPPHTFHLGGSIALFVPKPALLAPRSHNRVKEAGQASSSILQVKKLRLRETKWLATSTLPSRTAWGRPRPPNPAPLCGTAQHSLRTQACKCLHGSYPAVVRRAGGPGTACISALEPTPASTLWALLGSPPATEGHLAPQ